MVINFPRFRTTNVYLHSITAPELKVSQILTSEFKAFDNVGFQPMLPHCLLLPKAPGTFRAAMYGNPSLLCQGVHVIYLCGPTTTKAGRASSGQL